MTLDTGMTKPAFVSEKECKDIALLMQRKYAGFIAERYFDVAVTKDVVGVHAKVTLRNESGSFFYPVEGRISHQDTDLAPRESALFLLDYMDGYFDEYFREGGDCYLPIDWAEYESDGVPLQLKGQIYNLVVEKMADEFLAGNGALDDETTVEKPLLH